MSAPFPGEPRLTAGEQPRRAENPANRFRKESEMTDPSEQALPFSEAAHVVSADASPGEGNGVPATDHAPSGVGMPFSEAAREAAQAAIVATVDKRLAFNVAAYGAAWTGETSDTEFVCTDAAKIALAAAVDADPRTAACLALAALSDEELVERVVRALARFRFSDHDDARAILAGLGLPVDEQEA